MRVKDPPCLKCDFFSNCQQFFMKRKKKYDPERDLCEDYNSESFLMLGRKCNPLKQYLFLDEVVHPSRNEHFFWGFTMKNKISESAWIKRLNLFRDVWDVLLEPRSM